MKNILRFMLFPALLLMIIWLKGDRQENSTLTPARLSHIAYLQELSNPLGLMPDTGFEAKLTYPYQAALQEYIMTMDPSSRKIPARRRYIAARNANVLKSRRKFKSGDTPIQWSELAANTGGRTRALMFDPNDPEHKKVWAGAVTGGLWYTDDITDLDASWIPVGDFWENLAIGCICSDPNDPRTFYVGTGEGQTAFVTYRESSGTGWGIMRSKDAGTTWELMPSTTDFAYITDIQVRDEGGSSVIYVGTMSGEYQGKYFRTLPEPGLYRSVDEGETWSQVLPELPGRAYSYNVSDIEITTAGRIFVGTVNDLKLEGGGRVLYSDDGVNWTVVDRFALETEGTSVLNVPGRVMIASAPSDPDRIYALYGAGAMGGNGILYIYCNAILRSDDGGSNWTKGPVPEFQDNPAHPANWAYIAWHALTAVVDPEEPDILYVGGCDIHRSGDGGATWLWISDTQMVSVHMKNNCRYVHADQHNLLFQPGSRDLLLNANDGGVFMTWNARDSVPCWYERNKDFNTMQYYTCAMDPEKDVVHFLGGTQDNSTMLYEGTGPVTDDGNRYLGGDGSYCFVDKDEPYVHIISTQWNNYAFSDNLHDTLFEFGNMFKSGLFVNPADYDSRSNTLFANAQLQEGVYRGNIIIVTGIPYNPSGRFKPLNVNTQVPFSAVRVSGHSPAQVPVLFIGTQSGRLFKVFDVFFSSPVIQEIGSPDFPSANISCIQLGNSEAELLVTFSNYGVPSVWVSRDGGESWQNREGNLPDIPVRWALWHPANCSHVLLATEVGIWSCRDIWSEEVLWEPELEGLANVRVDMMELREADNLVIAATHGRGMYTGIWEVPSDSLSGPPDQEGYVNLYPNPTTGKVTIEYKPRWNETIAVEVMDLRGRKVLDARFASYAGEYRKVLDLGGLAPGTYLIRVEMGTEVSVHRLVLAGRLD